MNVLIAEDDPIARQVLHFQLQQLGHTVTTARDGAEAWDLLQTVDCPLMIVDWKMPRLTGIDLIKKVRESDRRGYIYSILLTANDADNALSTGMTSGADDFLQKPVTTEELHARLRPGLRIVELERRLAQDNRDLACRNQELFEAQEKMKRDLSAAARTQRSFLPSRALRIRNFAMDWHHAPCGEIGGDMLSVLPLGEEHSGVFFLDVSGKGIQPTLLAVHVCCSLCGQSGSESVLWTPDSDTRVLRPREPNEVLAMLNQSLLTQPFTGQYVTFLYGILNSRTGEFRYSVAGHPAPFLIAEPGIARQLPGSGLPLGIVGGMEFEEHCVRMRSGERLVLFSDGVTDTLDPNGEPFGYLRLLKSLESVERHSVSAVLTALLRQLGDWRGSSPLSDDISLLALEFQG